MENFMIDFGMYLSYIMIGIAAIAAVVFPVIFLIQDPKKAKGSLLGVLGLAVLFVISYFISGNELYAGLDSPFVSKLVGGGMIMFYLMFVISILSAIYSEIARIFK
jgi:hypothetical protein